MPVASILFTPKHVPGSSVTGKGGMFSTWQLTR